MDIGEKIKDVVAGVKPDHPHGLLSDAWQQAVHRFGPKIAKAMWEAFPNEVREKLSEGWVKELFQGVSLLVAQVLPNKGIAQMIDALQVEVAAELHELASAHKKGEPEQEKGTSVSAGSPPVAARYGVEGTEKIFRIEFERAEKLIVWFASAVAAGIDGKELAQFLNGLTLAELRVFADSDDDAKRVYAAERLKEPVPKVNSESLARKIVNWFGSRWEAAKACASEVNSGLEEIALIQERETLMLEQALEQKRAELRRPPTLWARLQFWKL